MSRFASFLLALPLALALLAGVEATSQADISAYLNAHNTVRAQHGATALKWNNTLAAAAQKWVNKCVFKHSGGSLGPYGGAFCFDYYSLLVCDGGELTISSPCLHDV